MPAMFVFTLDQGHPPPENPLSTQSDRVRRRTFGRNQCHNWVANSVGRLWAMWHIFGLARKATQSAVNEPGHKNHKLLRSRVQLQSHKPRPISRIPTTVHQSWQATHRALGKRVLDFRKLWEFWVLGCNIYLEISFYNSKTCLWSWEIF